MIRDADRQDLWNEYKSLMLSDPEMGKKLSEEFYVAHQEEMDAGAVVLWQSRWTYRRLFDEKISVGSRSFSLSYQNDAEDDENAIKRASTAQEKEKYSLLFEWLKNQTQRLFFVSQREMQTMWDYVVKSSKSICFCYSHAQTYCCAE